VVATFTGDLTPESLNVWLNLHMLPSLGEIGPANFGPYEETQLPLFWLFLNASCCEEQNVALKLTIASEGQRRRGQALFVWLDGDRYAHHAASMTSTPGVLPVLAAEREGEHFVYGSSLSSAESISSWVDLVLRGALRPTLRSQPPPLHNFGSLTVVVAATFEELVLSTEADVLLLVSAPWCRECDALGAVFEQLAERWATERGLRVATIDAGSNDLPRTLGVEKLPSVLFFPAAAQAKGGGQEGGSERPPPVDLSHLQSEAELNDAVMEHATRSLRRPPDVDALDDAVGMLPSLQREVQRLLRENEQLRETNRELRRGALPSEQPAA
jgi:thiol-disulfide isomerase/thioredoxin